VDSETHRAAGAGTAAADNPSAEWAARARLIAARLKRDYGAERVILFGSVARGTATRYSDLDLLVIAPSSETRRRRRAAVRDLVRDLTEVMFLSPIVITADELQHRLEIGDQFYGEILRTGVEL
jgi:predicted nucleotidyltransferase